MRSTGNRDFRDAGGVEVTSSYDRCDAGDFNFEIEIGYGFQFGKKVVSGLKAT